MSLYEKGIDHTEYDRIDPHVQEFIGALEYAVTGKEVQTSYEELSIGDHNPFEQLEPDQEYNAPEELVQDMLSE